PGGRHGAMAKVQASAERTIDASADAVYGYLADMHQHPHFLPPAFSDFQVEEGGVGSGTVTRFAVTAGGRTRNYLMRIAEPEPGRTLVESDANSSLVTTFHVEPQGDKSLVRISTSWDGAAGIGGFFERTFAPRAMHRMFLDELERLNVYALDQRTS
ncbi:MAG TPA: SRPBCC family protein, partial [Trebonia sp.]|nr:SRPBCC family protein [Trebonia sp.]